MHDGWRAAAASDAVAGLVAGASSCRGSSSATGTSSASVSSPSACSSRCVFYFGWSGGDVGEPLAEALLFLFGGMAYAAPIALFCSGTLIVTQPMLPAVHPLKAGAICLGAALTLGLAAGSLGLGPGHTPREGWLDPSYLKEHGGLVGESLLWVSAKFFSRRRLAHPVHLPAGGRACCSSPARRSPGSSPPRAPRRSPPASVCAAPRPPSTCPRSRSARCRAPFTRARRSRWSRPSPRTRSRWCAPPTWRRRRSTRSARYPDLYGDDDEPDAYEDEPEPAALEPADEEPAAEDLEPTEPLTPMGNRRSAVTESDEAEYRMPRPAFLKRSAAPRRSTRRASSGSGPSWSGRSATSTWTRA